MADPRPYRPCAGVVLAHPDGRIFAGLRRDLAGAWQMPQGGIDEGETAEAAALRELEEETGVPAHLVTVEAEMPDWVTYDFPPEMTAKIGRAFRGQSQRWFLLRFAGTDADVNVATAHPEFSDWAWLSVDEVLARIVPFKRAVYAQVLEAFRDRLA